MSKELRALVRWFRRGKRILPWREDPSVYRVWISEIMLQQTQVITVVPYFNRFIKKFPNLRKLALAGEEEVLKAWEGLGYYSRARNLHRAAKLLFERQTFKRQSWPQTKAQWLEVPGVGPYTAGAILSIAQGVPAPILDGNVERVLSRLFRLNRARGERAYRRRLWALARAGVTRADRLGLSPSDFNQAMMELGATLCVPKSPKCSECPIAFGCRAYASSDAQAYPAPKPPKEWIEKTETVEVRVSRDRKKVYLVENLSKQWRQGLWDFPKIEGKAPADFEIRYVVTRHRVSRKVVVKAGSPRMKKEQAKERAKERGRWVSLTHPEVPVGAPTRKILDLLIRRGEG